MNKSKVENASSFDAKNLFVYDEEYLIRKMFDLMPCSYNEELDAYTINPFLYQGCVFSYGVIKEHGTCYGSERVTRLKDGKSINLITEYPWMPGQKDTSILFSKVPMSSVTRMISSFEKLKNDEWE